MRTQLLAASLVLGLVVAATRAQQVGPAVINQLPDSVPSSIPRLPTGLPAPPATQPPTSIPGLTHQGEVLKQRTLVEALGQMPASELEQLAAKLKEQGIELENAERMIREGKLIPKADDLSIYRVIKDELKPIPINDDGLQPAFPSSVHPWGKALDPAETIRMRTAARSVGRIEIGERPHRLQGTGFVVGQGLIATNCHVLRQIAKPEGSRWTLTGPVLVDFANGSSHESTREFRVEGIQAYPQVPYLDVAILRVATTSTGGATPLPAPMQIRRTPIKLVQGEPDRLVTVIGYPDLDDVSLADRMTQNTYRILREVGTVAQTLSLGTIRGIDSHGGIDFVDHAASTHKGQSGSPVIDRVTGEVVAVHYCCASPNAPPDPSPLACSSQRLSDRENNEAVSTWTVVRDQTIGPLIPLGVVSRLIGFFATEPSTAR